METDPPESTWEALSAEILSGMREWHLQHPKATLRENAEALDQRFYRLRARMLHDVALQSAASDWHRARRCRVAEMPRL